MENGVRPVSFADIDGDGDIDVLTPVSWYENVDGERRFGPPVQTPGGTASDDVHAVDIDGDGDVDSLSTSPSGLSWHYNLDGKGKFGEKQKMALDSESVRSAIVADMDSDGDPDVLTSLMTGTVLWLENVGEGVRFRQQHVITQSAEDDATVLVSDLDGDGVADVVISSLSGISRFENRVIADSNDDGVFNSGDFVSVFQSGKYEDGIPDNATFDEGDWNQDGDFDTSDFVFAFQNGRYKAGAGPLQADIAAAVDAAFHSDEKRLAYVP